MKSLTILFILFQFCITSQAQEGKYAQVNRAQIYCEIHGELKATGNYENNKRTGTWKTYDENGQPKGSVEY